MQVLKSIKRKLKIGRKNKKYKKIKMHRSLARIVSLVNFDEKDQTDPFNKKNILEQRMKTKQNKINQTKKKNVPSLATMASPKKKNKLVLSARIMY